MPFVSFVIGDKNQVKNSTNVQEFFEDKFQYHENIEGGPADYFCPLFHKDGEETDSLKKADMDFSGYAKPEYKRVRTKLEKIFTTEKERDSYVNLVKTGGINELFDKADQSYKYYLDIFDKSVASYSYKESLNPILKSILVSDLNINRRKYKETLELSEEEYIKKNIINFDVFDAFVYNNEWFSKEDSLSFIIDNLSPLSHDYIKPLSYDNFRDKIIQIINGLPENALISSVVCDKI